MTLAQPGDGCPQGMTADIKALADGELRGSRQRRAKAHLDHCEACRSWDQWLRITAIQLRSMDSESAPPQLRARIMAAAAAHAAVPQPVPRRRALLTGAGLVLAAAAAAAAPAIIHRLTLPAPAAPVRRTAVHHLTLLQVMATHLTPSAPQPPTLSPDEAQVNRETERLYHERMQAAARTANNGSRPAPRGYAFTVQVSSGSLARATLLGWAAQNSAQLLSIHFQQAQPALAGHMPVGAPAETRILMRTTKRRLPQLQRLLGQLTLPLETHGSTPSLPVPTVGPPVTPKPAPGVGVTSLPPKSVKMAAITAAQGADGGPPVRVLVILRLPPTPGK